MHYHDQMNIHTILGLSDLGILRQLRRVFDAVWKDRNRVAVDLGANRGVYSLWLSQTGYFSEIHSFEPNPLLVKELKENISLNGFRIVEIHPIACADKVGAMDLILTESDSTSSVLEVTCAQKGRVRVDTTTLDHFFDNRNPPDFIKMDIEGAGVLALPHARKCIAKKRPLLYLESHSTDEDRAIGDLMRRLDYQGFRTRDEQWIERPDRVFPDPYGVFGNVIACPTEQHEQISRVLGTRGSGWMRQRAAA